MSIVGAPPRTAAAKHRAALEAARRLNALQVDSLARAVTSLDDEAGWARLTELGTRSTVAAQQTASTATADLLNATLNAADLVGDIADLPGINPGRLSSGKDVRGMFAMTRDVVANRVAGGASFAEGLDSSANVLTAIASSEPHRIARDGQFNQGLADERFNRYRRIAVGTSCRFCSMLATRGAVYLTRASAGEGRKYHYQCDCYVELVVDAAQVKARTGDAPFSELSKDWRNAVKSPDRLNAAQVRKDWADLETSEVKRLASAPDASADALDELARRLTPTYRAADAAVDAARAAEPELTALTSDLADRFGGRMEGLDFRLKTASSLDRKLTAEVAESGGTLTAAQAAAKMFDVNRYTTVYGEDGYADAVQASLDSLRADGHKLRVKNYWTVDKNPYQGVNVQITSPAGQQFELQFHTPYSLEVKEGEMHRIYELSRVETDPAKIAEYTRQSFEVAAKIPVPRGILEVA